MRAAYSIGLMSGTSMDGIDAALLKTDGTPHSLERYDFVSLSYSKEFQTLLKASEFAVKTVLGDWTKACQHFPEFLTQYLQTELKLPADEVKNMQQQLARYLQQEEKTDAPLSLEGVVQHSTLLHARAVRRLLDKTGFQSKHISVIGYHGQTLYHQPLQKISVIVGEGQLLSDLLHIPVVNDFRSEDVNQGGQGAPFAPLYHQALAIQYNLLPLAVVNCGGIANLTHIPTAQPKDLIGFDTGPGNGLLDKLVRQRTQGKYSFDKDGQFAQKGRVHDLILSTLFEKSILKRGTSYFHLVPPKALDIGDLTLLPELEGLSLEDACRTLAAFTAESIVHSLKFLSQDWPTHWILVGGGWQNPVIYNEFKDRLSKKMATTPCIQLGDEAGWPSQAVEAQTFAYLAVRRLQDQPISYPNTTGVPQPLTGGKIWMPK